MRFTIKCPACHDEVTRSKEPSNLIACKKCKLQYIYQSNQDKQKAIYEFSDESESEVETKIIPNFQYRVDDQEEKYNDDDESEYGEEEDNELQDDDSSSEAESLPFVIKNTSHLLKKSKSTASIPSKPFTSKIASGSKAYSLGPSTSKASSSQSKSQLGRTDIQVPTKFNIDFDSSSDNEIQLPEPIPQIALEDIKLPNFKLNIDVNSSEDEIQVPEPRKKKKMDKSDVMFDRSASLTDTDDETTPTTKKTKRKIKDIDDVFSDIDDEDDQDEEKVEQRRIAKKKKRGLTRREKVNVYDMLEKVENDHTPFKEWETNAVNYKEYKSGELVTKYVNQDGEERKIVPRVKGKRNLRKPEREYVKGPYRFGAKAGNKYNPFILFNTLYRSDVQKANPGINSRQLSDTVAQAYRDLDPAAKDKLINHARKLREQLAQHPPEEPDPAKKIKMPPTPFVLFQSEQGAKYKNEFGPTKEFQLYSKLMASKWKNLPEETRDEYKERSASMRKEYFEKYPEIHKQKMETMSRKQAAKRKSKG